MLHELNLTGTILMNVKATVQYYANIEPQPGPKHCIAWLKDDLPPEVLFHLDMIHGPPKLYKLLRN